MIMVAIGLLALVLRFAIVGLIRLNIAQNESEALGALKLISAALEKYAEDNDGIYPSNFSLLIQSNPSYLDQDYVSDSPLEGYIYSCPRLEPSGYTCYAAPLRCALTGKLTFSVTTGSPPISQECDKKE